MAHLQDLLIRLEPLLLLIAAVAFVRSGSARKYPAFASYFAIRGLFCMVLDALVWKGEPRNGTILYLVYYFGFYLNYLVVSIAIFFVIQEVFRKVMEPVPGLRRLGLMAFRWVSVVSLVVSVGTITLSANTRSVGLFYICKLGPSLMRCVTIMELCLVAFLALTIHALGRSFRSQLFGIAMGFGLQAAMDLINSALIVRFPGALSPVNTVSQFVTMGVLLMWATYFLLPEPATERNMIVLPPTSVMARWNALAKGIGQTPEAAVATPTTGFFLQDIEGVVDRVLAKNPVVTSR
ncbi:MAG TPA: hypothetical protein VME68_04435 [Acidobacteriaceae bacterium]|nr:hypothetical protein [Acidobacteriaceae bacterium]